MQKRRLISVALLSTFLLTGCGVKTYYQYNNPDSYTIGDGTITESVDTINVDWITGDVEFRTHSEDTIEVKDDCVGTLSEDNKLRYLVDDGTLYIKYRKSERRNVTINATKNLIITVPENIKFDTILVDAIESNVKGFLFGNLVKIDGVSSDANFSTNCDQFIFNSVSGNCDVTFSKSPNKIKTNSTSGDCKFYLPNCNGFLLNFTSVSGDYKISDQFENVTENDNVISYGDESTKITCKSISGDVEICK